jgi:hypothetical protein
LIIAAQTFFVISLSSLSDCWLTTAFVKAGRKLMVGDESF